MYFNYILILMLSCGQKKIAKQLPVMVLPAESKKFQSSIDPIANVLVNGGWMTSLSIGVLHPNGIEYYNYGRLNKGTFEAPTKNSVYEIGSISKVFTALLLANASLEGDVPIDDPIQSWSPEGWSIPKKDGVAISAAHLSSHTSGLPRLPVNFAPGDLRNPYVDYTPELLKAGLAETSLDSVPGSDVVYSNLGVGLLGYLLTERYQTEYDVLLRSQLLSPLQLNSTGVSISEAIQKRRVQGHDMIGVATPDWDFGSLFGMGDLNSSTKDLLRFASFQLNPGDGQLGEAIRLTHSPRMDRPGGGQVGLGWHIGLAEEKSILWHNGGTGGARSFLAFDPSNQTAVVILNSDPAPFTDMLGLSLMQILAGKPFNMEVPTVTKLTKQQLSEHCGKFQLGPDTVLSFSATESHLIVSIPGQPPFPVYPATEDKYFSVHAPLKFEFERSEINTVSGLFLIQGADRIPAPKIE